MSYKIDKEKCIKNLSKTMQINKTCHDLKKAYLSKQFPELTNKELEIKLTNDIIKRKEEQWQKYG